ncbi:carbohydrate ABC transporter permease [Brachybacterium sp. NBEC-018]|uniref:Carbohydrate ABC transporter permease n=1 Tax=Brachybacterium rhamnosum TaxID=173361 RepID=A0ABW4PWI2_9MICO|nr:MULTISPECIES: carbohydrate ABC transporter permease [unclassified Brachybacterium]QCR52860.1 carbohydrate ABC transporter permease [Brachybacterium sp. SGAir0954]UVY84916.1 carbohydrate ABC transporter permease [Brachybacterium sp. NBEC-018]
MSATTTLPAASGAARRTRPRTLSAFRGGPFTYGMLVILSAIFMVPLVFVVSIALASDSTVSTGQLTILPRDWQFSNFVEIFRTSLPVGRFMINSVIIAVTSAIGQVLSSSLVGYAFARLRAPGKKGLFLIVIATMMVPAQITMIPQFWIFSELGWVDTFLPLIVPQFFSNAFNIFLVRQFVTRIPYEMDEAASIDGLGFFGIYVRLILPMMSPILIAIAIFTLTAMWGDFMGPLIYINSEEKMPLALGVQYLTSTSQELQTPPWNLIMVGSIFLSLPMIVIYYFGQKYMYEMNLSAGSAGVK